MHRSNVTVATSESRLQPEPENFLGYRNFPRQTKGFDGLLSGQAFAVLALICLALGALVLLT